MISQVVLGHVAAISLPPVSLILVEAGVDKWPFVATRVAFRFGAQAAYLFVFLSGFMVAGDLLVSGSQKQPRPFAEFFRNRVKRLAAVVFAGLAITLVLDYCAGSVFGASRFYRHSYSYDMVATFDFPSLLGNIAFLEPTFFPSFGSNGPLWTLGYIVQFYLAGWIVAWCLSRSLSFALLAAAMMEISMAVIHPEWSIMFTVWLAGGLSRVLKTKVRHSFAVTSVGCGLLLASNLLPVAFSELATIPCGVMIVLGLSGAPEMLTQVRARKLRSLSVDSFIVYVVHHPVLMFVFAVVFDGRRSTDWHFFAFLIVGLAGVFLASAATKKLTSVERGQRVASQS